MKRLLLIAGMLFVAVAESASCSATERVDLASPPPSPTTGPVFTDPSRSDASIEDAAGPVLACIATECPDSYATCTSETGSTFKCGTNLAQDNNNCGACGNKCPNDINLWMMLNMTSRCVDGACAYQCYKHYSLVSNGFEDWTDCNGLIEDGCEANLTNDANNCGVCGNQCAAGTPCIDGKCGCPTGLLFCNGECVDPQWDDYNCGACGNACEVPADACEQPHVAYGCVLGQCGQKKCAVENNTQYYDCNKDVFANTCTGDGCEVDSLKTTENCGTCGNKCAANEECVNEGNGYECAVPCERSGKVRCSNTCVDLLNDVQNCGTCGNACRFGGDDESKLKETASCKEGLCVYECQPGFADCNNDPSDGCETDLSVHSKNCGACGVTCDVAAGQPCIEGKCLMQECDAGVTK